MASSRQLPAAYTTNTYGTGKDYTEGQLANWEADTDIDLVTPTSGKVLDVYKEGAAGALWDETSSLMLGATTNANYFRVIRAAASNGHSGIPADDGSHAGFNCAGAGDGLIRIYETFFQVHNIDALTGADGVRHCFDVSDYAGVKIVGCLASAPITNAVGFKFDAAGANTHTLINSLAYGCGIGVRCGGSGTYEILNCTVANSIASNYLEGSTGTYNADNCISENPGTSHFSGDWTKTTCMESGTDALTYINSGANDFHNASDSDAVDGGTDLSATFDDDVDGDTRSAWDVGFDEYQAAGGISIPVVMHHLLRH